MDSKEARNPRPLRALQKEVENLQNQSAVDFDKPMSKAEILRDLPDALLVGMRPILAEKLAEMCLPELEKLWKGRIVLQGNFMRNTLGQRVTESVEHDVPVSLPELRLIVAQALRDEDPELLHGDIVGAYLTAKLKGRPVFARVPKTVQGLFTGERA